MPAFEKMLGHPAATPPGSREKIFRESAERRFRSADPGAS
jgi:hypothetical protein